MWHDEVGRTAFSEAFLTSFDPSVWQGFRARLFDTTETADKPVGHLTKKWAKAPWTDSTNVVVAGGAFDCHMGAVGAGVKEHTFVRVIGTSTCDVMVADIRRSATS
jgi:L-ribulokinase